MIRGAFAGSPLRRLVGTLVLAAVYFALGHIGLALGPVHVFASLVWAPAGVALGALLLLGDELWPGIALGAFLVNVVSGAPLASALGIALGNTLEGLGGAYLIRRLGGFSGALDSLRAVLVLIVPAAVLSTALGATVGVSSLFAGGRILPGEVFDTWRTWWLGDAVGDLVVGSFLLAWHEVRPTALRFARVLEALALCAAIAGASFIIFTSLPASEAGRFIQACLLMPLLMWGALRFGMKGATASVFLASAMAVWGATVGRGPFVRTTLSESLFFLQSFMASTATAVLVLGAVITERARVYDAERTSRLRAEAAEREAKRLVEEKERLVAVVSHDLRNPLGAITAGITLFRRQRGPRLEPWEDALLERQYRSAARMEEIIRNVLYFAMARTQGSIPVKAERIQMGDVCRQVIAEMEQAEPGREVSLRVEANDSGEWDAARMAQVLSNLIGNAFQYSPKGTPVDVRIRGSSQNLVLQVHNLGPPIPPERLSGIFEPFKQGPQARNAKVNVGLGLYIVKEIVEAHEGKVDVCSRVDQGTSFVVKLPRLKQGTGRWRPIEPGDFPPTSAS
ncbi:MAG TPA: MASE1 domain-containing protein [Anaeromyxobacteraceae bacterium]|nr:MASE1 domain-containing protein [Anaeromyxobacteraceae bacterium]